MITSLLPHLKTDAILLTPNQRLAATLIKQYNQAQRDQGQTSWLTPAIRPLASWIQDQWNHYCAQAMDSHFLPLTGNQELILWEALIAEWPESEPLLKLSDLARQAKSAWTTLKLWQTDFHHPAFSFTENCRHFQNWATQFAERCQRKRWLDSASLTEQLIEKIQQGKIRLPAQLILLNFTELAPLYQTLLTACEQQGVDIQKQQHQATSTPFQISLNDEATEIQTMLRWARKIHEQQPQANIGCIVAELEEKRDTIIAVLNELFEDAASYNLSAGKTLASYPVIQQALQLLALSPHTTSSATLSAILHSPFIGDAEKEMLQRIQLDSQLRHRNITTITWVAFLADKHTQHCEHLTARLKHYLAQRAAPPSSQTISQWLAHFAQLLEACGWPGEQSLNSTEYQVVTRWMDLLLETSALDHILPHQSYHQALHYLTVLAQKTYFQPETPDAPIQILGQLEGAGLPFDYLWVMGLDDTAWPPVPSPSPFIPHELQKSLNMPHATADRQLEYSLRLMQQYQYATPYLICSYSQHTEKEELRPSPLLAHLKRITHADLTLAPLQSAYLTVFQAQHLEYLQDEQAAPVLVQDKLPGGTSIFAMQAACPFKAFATLRLGARALEEPEAGLPAKNRGSIVHKALELFWKETTDQQTLLAYSEAQLQQKIQTVITAALQQLAPFIRAETLYHSLVGQRLSHLLAQWLTLEKARPPFSVNAIEQEKEIVIDHSPITVRVDRIDELATGEKIIIDYKTKKDCDTSTWFGQRPDEPQLPLYCISHPETIIGLAFAQLHASKIAMNGLAQKDLNLAGIKTISGKTKADAPSWEEQLIQWQLHLLQLFHDFKNGNAAVDPKNAAETCRYCDLQALCRIHESEPSYE